MGESKDRDTAAAMTVAEMIERLGAFDPEAEVFFLVAVGSAVPVDEIGTMPLAKGGTNALLRSYGSPLSADELERLAEPLAPEDR